MEWANPTEKQACKNSSTVPNGQLTGSSWRSPHPESQLQGYSFLIEGAIGERCTDEASAKSVPQHPAPAELDESEITRGDSAISDESQADPPPGPNSPYLLQPPQGAEASIPRASATASTGPWRAEASKNSLSERRPDDTHQKFELLGVEAST